MCSQCFDCMGYRLPVRLGSSTKPARIVFDFIKYHGLGNDFVLFVEQDTEQLEFTPEFAQSVCRRGTGVGADGVMRLHQVGGAPPRMDLLNADGSRPEMCGNGLRCFVKYAVEELGYALNPLPVETPAGVLDCLWKQDHQGRVESVRVAMGKPEFEQRAIGMAGNGTSLDLTLETSDGPLQAHGVGIGNPHMVIFEAADREKAERLGPELSGHPLWTQGTNVEWVSLTGARSMDVMVYERGCGITQACGTGATAAAAAAVRLGKIAGGGPIEVHLLGGSLTITVNDDLSTAWMSGPCEEVYRGQWRPR